MNEDAIDLDESEKNFYDKFIFYKEIYTIESAYLFVFSLMVLCIPPSLKFLCSDAFLFLGKLLKPTIGKYNSFLFLIAWQKVLSRAVE